MERFCLDCNSLLQGRADKKFCDDQCRSSHHHRLNARDHGFVNQVNQILKKNRSILKETIPNGKIRVNRDKLLIKGFNFNFRTHTYLNKRGDTYFFCYEFGYLILKDNELLVVKQEEK
ncbi:hypothetical protein [Pedobacter insulae]|uniref:DUF2116 family Zn-ribbon domain-containing protein n=1 Tax=Pedobacter insulae TaxID=414048 RepID=A0A1I2Y4D4_9SPHI|nr:hypothetical protein [Pedobacter insulae]SFH20505.1 hypothetical protein SAMN04489864_106217 [Pedobacter insulae]